MSWLVTADLHLDDKAQHSYRWGIFDWLAKQQKEHKAFQGVLLLGDLTDQKDNHSASLVNRMVEGLGKLCNPLILKGNHDYIDPKNPFFRFLSEIEGIEFITEPKIVDDNFGAIPHQPNQKAFDEACKRVLQRPLKLVLLHGLFEGAISETGRRLTGLRTSLIEKNHRGLVLAGDVHAPQQVGCVTYVGAPYRVRFGDDYQPRVLLLTNGCTKDLYYPCPMKHSVTIRDIEELQNAAFRHGDQVKVTLELPREEIIYWAKHKQSVVDVCKDMNLELFGPTLKLPEAKRAVKGAKVSTRTPTEILEDFCTAEDIQGDIKEAGLALLGTEEGR